MSHKDVSPKQGHASVARQRETAPVHSVHSSYPRLFSQYRGPVLYNMAQDPDPKDPPNDPKDDPKDPPKDPEKQSNFDKVREKAEREEAARKKAEAELEELRRKEKEREEKELEDQKRYQDLSEQRKTDLEAERQKREDAEKELAEFKKAQEDELSSLMDSLPDDSKADLPIDDSMTTAQKLKIVRREKAMLQKEEPADPVGAGVRNKKESEKAERLKELLRKPRRTEEESEEMRKLDLELNG